MLQHPISVIENYKSLDAGSHRANTDHLHVYYFDLAGYEQSKMRDEQDVVLVAQNTVLTA